jgi:hypothetical protein
VKRSQVRLIGLGLRLALGLGALTALAACGRNIGDGCSISTDCSAAGDRSCDLSQPGGYCTIEGCDDHSCPDSSVCVRFFPIDFLNTGCIADKNDPNPCMDAADICISCDPAGDGAICGTDTTGAPLADGVQPGLCAPRSTEHRLCVKTCSNNGDCRGGYECRKGGTRGSVPLISDPNGTAQFCVPMPG